MDCKKQAVEFSMKSYVYDNDKLVESREGKPMK